MILKSNYWENKVYISDHFIPIPRLIEYLSIAGIIFYFCLHHYFTELPLEAIIGYIDTINFLRPYDDVLQGKIFHKDFFWGYGPLLLYMQVPFYSLLGKNHYAFHLIYYVIMPCFSILFSYLYIKLLLNNGFLRVLFVAVGLFHYANSQWLDVRHLGAEIAIAYYIYYLSGKTHFKNSIVVGALAGIGLLMDPIYGGIGIFVISCGTLLSLYRINNPPSPKHATGMIIGLVAALSPFALYLFAHKALFSYLTFFYNFATQYSGVHSTRGELFPVFPIPSYEGVWPFIESVYSGITSQAFRFYLPPLIYTLALLIFALLYFNDREKTSIKYFLLSTYGFITFMRTLTGPSYEIMGYGIVPALTLGFLFLGWLVQKIKNDFFKNPSSYFSPALFAFSLCLLWLGLTLEDKRLMHFDTKEKSQKNRDKVYYDKVGFEISKESYEQFSIINTFIEKNTRPNEFLFVYPWGPYNHFTGRPYPLLSNDARYTIIGPDAHGLAVKRLEEIKPRFVVLNWKNAGGVVVIGDIRGDSPTQISWRTPDSPNFISNGDQIQIYILENYHLTKRFKFAAILERNEERKFFFRPLKTTDIFSVGRDKIFSGGRALHEKPIFRVSSRKAKFGYTLKEPIRATHLAIDFTLRTSALKKIFTKSIIQFGVGFPGAINHFALNYNDLADLGKRKSITTAITVPIKELIKPVKAIWVELKTPEPYLLPEILEIHSIRLLYDRRVD